MYVVVYDNSTQMTAGNEEPCCAKSIFVIHIGKFFSPYDEKGSIKSAVVIIHLRKTTAALCVNGTFLNILKIQGSHHIMF